MDIAIMFEFLFNLLNSGVDVFNDTFQETAPSHIVFATAALYFAYNQYQNPSIYRAIRARHNTTATQQALDSVYAVAKYIPAVRRFAEGEAYKEIESVRSELATLRSKMNLRETLPDDGVPIADILREFDIDVKNCNYNFLAVTDHHPDRTFTVQPGDGQDSGVVYTAHPKELTEAIKEVVGKTALVNPMHEHKSPRILAMKAEIIHWCQHLFHGSPKGYGIITHGGSTSIIEAMTAYVIRARQNGIQFPEIVVPETAHAAFHKAALITGATLIKVPVDPRTGAVSPATMEKYISKQTAVIVGSVPQYMDGICDPAKELGQLALKHRLPLHLDACLGGFYWALKGQDDKPFDFRVKGVSSISADFHKFGYCPKGSSVCLFSEDSPALPIYAALNWRGGLYATPNLLDGSTSGARIAEIYVTMLYYGRKRYQQIAETIGAMRQQIQQKVAEAFPQPVAGGKREFYVFGQPELFLLGFRSDTLNAHFIANEMDYRGWKLNSLQDPDGFHLCLTHVHTLIPGLADKFIKDLKESIDDVKKYPPDFKPKGKVKVYGKLKTTPSEIQQKIGIDYQRALLFYAAPQAAASDAKPIASAEGALSNKT